MAINIHYIYSIFDSSNCANSSHVYDSINCNNCYEIADYMMLITVHIVMIVCIYNEKFIDYIKQIFDQNKILCFTLNNLYSL